MPTRFKPSEKFIKSFQHGSTRMVIALMSIMILLGYLIFFGPAKYDGDPVVPFFLTALVVSGTCFMQVRRHRKTAAGLTTLSYVLLDEGISVESSGESYVILYKSILAVTIKRRFFSEDIAQILLRGAGGVAALVPLDTPDAFLMALRQRMDAVQFIEKRWFLG